MSRNCGTKGSLRARSIFGKDALLSYILASIIMHMLLDKDEACGWQICGRPKAAPALESLMQTGTEGS
jgi:hypothetical protein